MSNNHKQYSKMKDSGVSWMGAVPDHWAVQKLKHLTRFYNGIAFKPSDWTHSGIPIIRIQNLNGSNHFNYTTRTDLPRFLLIRRGDLLFSWSGNRGTSFGPYIWTRDFEGYLNQHIFKLNGYSLNRRYFTYLLRAVTRHIEEQSHGIIGLVHITKPELGAVPVPVASLDEQVVIARFLDHADRRFRHYIQAKQKLISLIEEQRQAIIYHAVTRGLDPNVCLRPSGVAWLSDIPQHWDIKRGKTLFAESHLPVTAEDEIVTCFRDGQVTLRRNRRTTGFMIALKEAGYQGVRRGQLVIHAMDAFAGAVGVCDSDGKCTPEYIVCNPRVEGTVPAYFGLCLRIAARFKFIQVCCPAVRERAPRLRYPNFGQMLLPMPPPIEQSAIVVFVEHSTANLLKAIDRANREISLVHEYRVRLIADVVTGKLDVREAAAQLPEEIEEAMGSEILIETTESDVPGEEREEFDAN